MCTFAITKRWNNKKMITTAQTQPTNTTNRILSREDIKKKIVITFKTKSLPSLFYPHCHSCMRHRCLPFSSARFLLTHPGNLNKCLEPEGDRCNAKRKHITSQVFFTQVHGCTFHIIHSLASPRFCSIAFEFKHGWQELFHPFIIKGWPDGTSTAAVSN